MTKVMPPKASYRRVEDAAGPQNVAYAWTNDFSAVRPETWVEVEYKKIDEIILNGQKQDVMRWVKINSSIWTNGQNVWNPQSRLWEDYKK
jgi:hypothetical protein